MYDTRIPTPWCAAVMAQPSERRLSIPVRERGGPRSVSALSRITSLSTQKELVS